MAIPLLDSLDLKDKDFTADALLTQRKLAKYLVEQTPGPLPLHRQSQSGHAA